MSWVHFNYIKAHIRKKQTQIDPLRDYIIPKKGTNIGVTPKIYSRPIKWTRLMKTWTHPRMIWGEFIILYERASVIYQSAIRLMWPTGSRIYVPLTLSIGPTCEFYEPITTVLSPHMHFIRPLPAGNEVDQSQKVNYEIDSFPNWIIHQAYSHKKKTLLYVLECFRLLSFPIT